MPAVQTGDLVQVVDGMSAAAAGILLYERGTVIFIDPSSEKPYWVAFGTREATFQRNALHVILGSGGMLDASSPKTPPTLEVTFPRPQQKRWKLLQRQVESVNCESDTARQCSLCTGPCSGITA